MTIRRKYDFQAGTKINSSQVDEELDNLVNAANALEAQDEVIKKTAQMYKMVDDIGNRKLIPTQTDIKSLQPGHYYGSDLTNAPLNSNSLLTVDVYAAPNKKDFVVRRSFDAKKWEASIHTDGTFIGWNQVLFDKDFSQSVLWSGGSFPNGDTTIIPTKKLSECLNGWILIWSDFDPETEKKNDWDFAFDFIPKQFGQLYNSDTAYFTMAQGLGNLNYGLTVKRLYIFDNKIVGHDDNVSTTNNASDVVLRNILEF